MNHYLKDRWFAIMFLLWLATTSVNAAEQPTFDPATYKGKHLLLLLFSINDSRAGSVLSLMKELYGVRKEFNFEIAAACLNAGKEQEAREFIMAYRPPFPVFLDATGQLASTFRITSGLGLIIYDKDGKVIATKDAVPSSWHSDLTASLKGFISRYINIGYVADDVPVLGYKPQIPVFEAPTLNGPSINIKTLYEKKPLVILIFSPSCSHCQHELDFLHKLYTGEEFKNRFEVVAISRGNQESTLSMTQKRGYTFPVVLDGNGAFSSLFPSFIGTVPISYLVDRDGRINYQHTGFSEYTEDSYLMELRKLCRLPNPPRLNPSGYSGQERCMICHEREHIQWSLTRHADAFLSVIRKGNERNPACVSCHVTGFEQPGGYSLSNIKHSRHFENVQCESCHGPGYQSCTAFTGTKPKKRTIEQWEAICRTCHTTKESLNFKFETRFPRVMHTSVPNLSAMSRQEREAVLRTYREKKNLFDNPASYMGADSCRTCHPEQYRHWQTSTHATVHTHEQARSAGPEKQYRYYTGIGRPGGYPEPGREGVQCEACHGPGERHIKAPDKKGHEYIVSLGEECQSCVVEQICRTCHGPSDDPQFDFNTYFPKIRHPQKRSSQPETQRGP